MTNPMEQCDMMRCNGCLNCLMLVMVLCRNWWMCSTEFTRLTTQRTAWHSRLYWQPFCTHEVWFEVRHILKHYSGTVIRQRDMTENN